jgi:hypothetical protein
VFWSNAGAGSPVTAGSWYYVTCLAWSPQGWAAGVSAALSVYTSGGGLIGTFSSAAIPLTAGSLTFVQLGPVQIPVTGAVGAPIVYAGGTPGSSVLFYVTDVQLTQASVVIAGGASGITATEVPYLDNFRLSSDRALLYNQAILNQFGTATKTTFTQADLVFQPTSGVTVQITNQASVTQRGQVPYTATIYEINTAQALPYVLSDPSMEDFGNWVVQTQAQPLLRVLGATVTPASTPQAVLTALGCEVGDTVTVRRRQISAPTVEILAFCSKLTHHIDIGGASWTTAYEVSPSFSAGNVLACDSVTAGCLTGGPVFGW